MDFFYLLLQFVIFLFGAEVVSPCLRCFTTSKERDDICRYAVSMEKMEAVDCLQRLQRGFDPLNTISIAFSQVPDIKKHLKTFGDEVKKIDNLFFPHAWVEQFEYKMADFVKGVKERVAGHPAPQCRPPCGRQKEAWTFSCSKCSVVECQLPISCPIQETQVIAHEKTLIPCGGTFGMPEHHQITWKFAKDSWTQDLSLFKEIDQERGQYLEFSPALVTDKGTYMCEVFDEKDNIISARAFRYLNVRREKTEEGMRVQSIFNRVLIPATIPTETKKNVEENHLPPTTDPTTAFFQSNIGIAICAGVGIMVCTILVGLLWRYSISVDW